MRIFKSDDGAELREEDVRDILGFCELATDASDRIVAALTPKTCGAIFVGAGSPYRDDFDASGRRCVLPPGHHPFDPVTDQGDDPYSVICRRPCNKVAVNPIHSAGHMTDPECWREA